jgi:hypothetical protein
MEWELNQNFQDIRAAKLLWAKVVIGEDGRLSMVRCKVCNVGNLLVPKFDGLQKHVGRRKAKHAYLRVCAREYFMSFKS